MNRNFTVVLFAALMVGKSHAATLYVDSRQDIGHGSETHHFPTIAKALKNVAPGDRLLIAPGVYRESLDFATTSLKGDYHSRVIVEGAPGGEVIIKGSNVVVGWESLGDGRFVKRDWTVNSQQVFVDGVSLRQIGGTISSQFPAGKWKGRIEGDENSMLAGDFHYDAAAKALYIRPNGGILDGKTVEVSVRPYFVHAYGVDGYTLRNLTFTHSNSTALGQAGALRLIGSDIAIDSIKVMDCDGAGITIRGNNNVVKDSLFTRCGQFGVTGSGRNVKWTNNEISYNNTRGFDHYWGAGGMKFMAASPLGGVKGLHDSEFVGNRVIFNKGDGIWFDADNKNNLIKNNLSAYNEGSGIHYEISFGGRIVNNFIFGNTQRGIYISNSADTIALHNLVACNGLEGIYAQNSAKRVEKYPARNNEVVGNIIAWSGKHAVRLPAADYNNVSDRNLIVGTAPLYGVWDDAGNPSVNGLVKWQEQFGQDKNSWERTLAIPAELAAKIKNEQLNVDWKALLSLASRLESGGLKKQPGPQE